MKSVPIKKTYKQRMFDWREYHIQVQYFWRDADQAPTPLRGVSVWRAFVRRPLSRAKFIVESVNGL